LLRGYVGTDLPGVNPQVREVRCPYTNEKIATVPAINPDVTVLHAQAADRQGNILIRGIVGAQKEAALAARTLIVTVEEIVESLDAPMNAIVLPHWVVATIAEVPTGAYPSYALGYYARDNAFYLARRNDDDRGRAPDLAGLCLLRRHRGAFRGREPCAPDSRARHSTDL
jgi:glutaconate CoA-transferase subunit A